MPVPTVVVDTPVGQIRGNDRELYHEYLGIPYAQPPVGALRWRPPLPLAPFEDVYDATVMGSKCEQFGVGSQLLSASEDCLFLNVWRPVEDSSDASLRPVLVFIHGGAFSLGSSSDSFYDGGVLASSRDVVVVSMNYRLGYLGFLALPELTAEAGGSGNYVFHDQQLALQWVQDNIAAFGGDQDRVMVFGQSAGAMSTCMQLASAGSASLFQSAAIQSGFCLDKVLSQEEAHVAGIEFANLAGCGGEDRLACLRAKSIDEINDALQAAGIRDLPLRPSSALATVPVVDGLFIDRPPRELLEAGVAAGKSVIIGVTKDEGSLFTAFTDKIPDEPSYLSLLTEEYSEHAAAVAAMYPFAEYQTGRAAYAELLGDRFFVCNAIGTADSLALGGANVYFYEFLQQVNSPLVGIFDLIASDLNFSTMHGAEVPYIFGFNFGGLAFSEQETLMVELMQGFWVNNAANNSPNNTNLPIWPNYTYSNPAYLQIGETQEVASGLKEEKCNLLNGLPLISI